MIDIHSHIIPGIDDGSEDINMTLEMLRNAEADGTKTIVATPHFCRGYGEEEYSKVREKVQELNKKCKEIGISIEIKHGQEVYYSEGMIQDYKDGIIGTINDTKYMLFEFPMTKLDNDIFDIIYELQVMGINLILAHPERYKFIIDNPSVINKFIDEGILFQMNAGSICGDFGKTVKKTAEVLLKNGVYNFIGSDAHNNRRRVTGIKKGIVEAEKINQIYKYHFNESAEMLLNNEDVIFQGKKINERRSFISFFTGK